MVSTERLPLQIMLALLACAATIGCAGGRQARPRSGIVLIRQIEGYGSVEMTFSPTGHSLGLVTAKSLVVLDPVRNRVLFSAELPIRADEISDRDCVFSQDGGLFAASLNNALVIVDLSSETVLVSEAYPRECSLTSMGALAFTPDGTRLLIGGQMDQVQVMDIASGHFVTSLGPLGSVIGIGIMPDGETAAIARRLSEVLLWKWESNEIADTLGQCDSWCVALEVVGRYLLAGCGGHSIRVWDSPTHEYLGSIQGHDFIGLHFAASDTRDLLIAGSGPGTPNNRDGVTTSEILLIDLRSLEVVHSWRAHTAQGVYATAISKDGEIFATCGYDGIIDIWTWQE